MGLARYLKQGVDVWLNNPVRPLEASGTSGMKVAANGGLNLSILDGWWLEACDGANGWAIGSADKTYPNQELQDQLDNEQLLRLLEDEVVPLYFDRDEDGLPQGWLDRVVHDLSTIPAVFDTDRMVGEYTELGYRPLAASHQSLVADDFALVENEAARRERVARQFAEVRIREVRVPDLHSVRTGDEVVVEADIELGGLEPDAIEVELLIGHATNRHDELSGFVAQRLAPVGPAEGGGVLYRTSRLVAASGTYRYGLRVRPRRRGPWDQDMIDLTVWA
ncbi:MAG: hypothetical protein R3F34_08815 [Planctomycetota bacterium]